jgi:hypothetical protein
MSREQDRWDAGELDYKSERDTPRPDFDLMNQGSICLLTPRTPAAHDWADIHLLEGAMRWGPSSIVVEPRYVQAIIDGAEAEGLTVEVL